LAALPLIILCLTYLFDGALVALVAGAAAFFLFVPQLKGS
jgi:hypothetical protein